MELGRGVVILMVLSIVAFFTCVTAYLAVPAIANAVRRRRLWRMCERWRGE